MSSPTTLDGAPQEIIACGAELGSFALFGRRTPVGWEFRTVLRDHSAAMLEEDGESSEPIHEESGWVTSWAAAMGLLDRRPWARLIPLRVHPEFREEVLVEVTRRLLLKGDSRAHSVMTRWTAACKSG